MASFYLLFCCFVGGPLCYLGFLLISFPATMKRHALHPEKKTNFFVEAFLFLTLPIRIIFLVVLPIIFKILYTGIIFLVSVGTVLYLIFGRFGRVFGRMFRGIGAYFKKIQEMIIWMEDNTPEYVGTKHSEAIKWSESFAPAILTRLPVIDLLTSSTSLQLTHFFNLTGLFAPILFSQALNPKLNFITRSKAIQGLAKLDRPDDLLHILQPETSPEVCLATVKAMQESFTTREVVIAWSLLARHSDLDIRLKAAESLDDLNRLSEAGSAYLALKNDENTTMSIRIQAAGRLARQGKLPETLGMLCEQMESNPAPMERLEAAEALCAADERIQSAKGRLDPELYRRSQEARQTIVDFIFNRDVDSSTRAEAVHILGRLKDNQTLKEQVTNPHLEPAERWQVILGLLQVNEFDTAAISWLDLATQPELPENLLSEIIHSASQFLSDQVDPKVKEDLLPKVLDALMHFAQDETYDGTLRLDAANALEKLGWYDKASAIYLLLSNSQGLQPALRREASQAMRQLITRPAT